MNKEIKSEVKELQGKRLIEITSEVVQVVTEEQLLKQKVNYENQLARINSLLAKFV